MIIPNGYAQCTIPFKHTALVREAVITFGVQLTAATEPLEDLANTIFGAFYGTLGGAITTEVQMGPLRMSVGSTSGENLAIEGNVAHMGPVETKVEPANIACLVKKITSRGGRRGRGRFFIPWTLDESQVSEVGTITPATVSDMQGLAAGFLSTLGGGTIGCPMVILHTTGVSATGSPNVVSSLQVDSTIGVQRRRLGR